MLPTAGGWYGGGMQTVEVEKRFDAPRQKVWDVYTDHVSWTEWAGTGKVRLEREGSPDRDGVGCVRVISNGPVAAYEEVLSFDPPKRMTYQVVKGVPMKNHLGEVVFEDDGDGTLVRWRCRFDSGIPGLGFLLRAVAARTFRTALDGLERRLRL